MDFKSKKSIFVNSEHSLFLVGAKLSLGGGSERGRRETSGVCQQTKPRTLQGSILRSGFSLVETIIYIGLLVLILVAIINMTLLMSHSYNYLKLSRHTQTSAVTALDRMIRDIRNAQSVNAGQSTLGSSPGVLTLNTTTATGTPQILQFYVSSGAIRVKQDGGDVGPLTLPDVTVGSLIFRQISTGISSAVKIELTLQAGVGPSVRSANFYATAILRDSY